MATIAASEARRRTTGNHVLGVLRVVVIVWMAISPLGNTALAHGLGGLGGLLGHGFRGHGILSGHPGTISRGSGTWAQFARGLRARQGVRIPVHGRQAGSAPVPHAWSGGHRLGGYAGYSYRLGFRPFLHRDVPFEYGYPAYGYPWQEYANWSDPMGAVPP